ncbi:MAG: sugar ABC transporter ATP-binding protein [Caldilineaceae bacterium]
MTTTAPMPTNDDVALRATDITKLFPGTVALDHVNFNVYRGKVNVLVGENGAGKSTLMKILAGVYPPTHGKLLLDGKEVNFKSPTDAARQGIGIIYQEMNLFPNLSVTENIFMAREVTQGGVMIDNKTQTERTHALLQRLRQPIQPSDLVADLRIGQQQIVEIAKALAQDARILIMDEPTSALSTAEVAVLFEVIRELKAHGVSIIYISHKLDELLQIGDYVTVLRDGKLVAEQPAKAINVPWIIEQMVGRNPAALFHGAEHAIGGELLRVEELTLPRQGGGFLLDHVSFTLHHGEILGLYGLMGAGRSELLECLAGVRQGATGKIWLEGAAVKAGSVQERIGLGVTLVPEDRQRDGLVPTLSVANNMLLASLRNYLSRFFLSTQKEEQAVRASVKELSVKVANPRQLITALSGGNQQKVVVAKSLLTKPKLLLLDEPSRGIDVAAKSEIFAIMSRLAAEGYGIVFTSSELKEVLAMSDRILVMAKGKITGEYRRAEATEEKLVHDSAVGHGLGDRDQRSETRDQRPEDRRQKVEANSDF